MRTIALLVALLAFPPLAMAEPFSATATSLVPVYLRKGSIVSTSPDGARRAVAKIKGRGDTERMVVDVSGPREAGEFAVPYGPNAEMLWAPDSRALFVTGNDGGAVGGYELQVIGKFGPRLTSRDITPLIAKAFGHPVRCYVPEPPNVAGVAWLGTSRRLLVAAEILPHSNCDSMGTFELFEVDPFTLTITHRFSQLQAKAIYGALLGPDLKAADDNCTRNPQSCWIPALHPPPGLGPRPEQLAKSLGVERRVELSSVRCGEGGDSYFCTYLQRSSSGELSRWSAWVHRRGEGWELDGPPYRNPATGPADP